MIEKHCIECGKAFLIKKYREETAKFCSRKCYADYDRGKIRKECVTGNNGYRKTKKNGTSCLSHRYIVSNILGRTLRKGEIIHHKNGDKSDNKVDNLLVLNSKEHSFLHNQKHPVVKNCLVCGKEFTPKPTKRKTAKTCSSDCLKLLQSIMFRNPNAQNSKYREKAYQSQKKKQILINESQVAYQIIRAIRETDNA